MSGGIWAGQECILLSTSLLLSKKGRPLNPKLEHEKDVIKSRFVVSDDVFGCE
jgi:hypothetical protein